MAVNPLHEAPPSVRIIRSTVIPAQGTGNSSTINSTSSHAVYAITTTPHNNQNIINKNEPGDLVLHTLCLELNAWRWHVSIHWAQLNDLATALRRWRWKVFFFRSLIPPLNPQRSKTRPPSHKHAQRVKPRPRTHSKDDDYVDGWSYACDLSYEEAVGETQEGTGVGWRPARNSRGRGRERASWDRHVQRNAVSAPPLSAEETPSEEDVGDDLPPRHGPQGDELDPQELDRGNVRWRLRQARLQQRREEAAQERERRWARLSHRTSFSSRKPVSPSPRSGDLRCPLTPAQARLTDPVSLAHQRTACEQYVRTVLEDVVNRHCPQLLALLQVSPYTFDRSGGPSHREGRVLTCAWRSREGDHRLQGGREDEGGMDLEGLDPLGGSPLGFSALGKRGPYRASKLREGWAVLKSSYLAIYKDGGFHPPHVKRGRSADVAEANTPEAVLLFDTGTTLQAAIFEAPRCLVLINPHWHFQLTFRSRLEQREWAATLASVLKASPWVERNRFEFARSLPLSYLDDSAQSTAQWFVDGAAAYRSMEAAIQGARRSIFLSAPWVCPELYLLRPPHRFPASRLDRLLEKKAAEGVRISVLLFQEPEGGNLQWKSRETQARLMALAHMGHIHVLRTRPAPFPHAWIRNETLLCVDQEVGFVGSGLSFGLGKFDTPQHVLKDEAAVAPRRVQDAQARPGTGVQARRPTWCGRDYQNPLVKDMCLVELAHTSQELPYHHRGTVPRLPQHTACVAVTGSACHDLCWHFVNQWNLERAREMEARHAIPNARLRQEEFAFALPPPLLPVRLRVGPSPAGGIPPHHLPSHNQADTSSAETDGPVGVDGLARKTVTRLVFGTASSVARPVPSTEEDHGGPPRDVFDAVEQEASQKLKEWLRPRKERRQRRLLELQHDVNLTSQCQVLQFQALVEPPMAPPASRSWANEEVDTKTSLSFPRRHPPRGWAMNEEVEDDAVGCQDRKSSSSSHRSPQLCRDVKEDKNVRVYSSPLSGSAPSSPSKQQLDLLAEAAKDRTGTSQQGQKRQQRMYQYLRLRRALHVRELEAEEEEEVSLGPLASCHCRVVRSLGAWSGALLEPQRSVLEAYEQVISNAEHYLYFENPTFISGVQGTADVSNRLAEALLNRIVRAHDSQETFRVVFLLPLLPVYEGGLHGATPPMLTSALYQQLNSVNTLWRRLQDMVPRPDEYLQFFGLRSYTRLNGDPGKGLAPHLVSEQIFVNSRLLVADDRYVVLGSAALNDRSLMGTRDSEMALVLEDTVWEPGAMNHADYHAGRFARSLRLRLWGEHVGLLDEYVQRRVLEAAMMEDGREELLDHEPAPEEVYAPLLDPSGAATWAYLRRVARKNTAILAHVFPQALPAHTVRSIEALKHVVVDGTVSEATRTFVEEVLGEERAQEEEEILMDALLKEEEGQNDGGTFEDVGGMIRGGEHRDAVKEKLKWLGRLQGHLVEYPKEFLADDLTSLRPVNGLQGWSL
ncbi:hypothetical protein NSK_002639 [Nannochloropsis salina CCMP1776]|uniref:phospholipase D n=1 Tax=Nannochloropsis salina CCMP1776 TaxID=1027361 RepID=A0A4D9DBB6_9STRA|nr:hypothetical protein NSK_002639 [Nannochloropsis salina CCMP1776]|eukprot:TFJ85819.1 hypothetical protein NSK_002639 [Nannochloropsis salina CCMP1776]